MGATIIALEKIRPQLPYERGYVNLFLDKVNQAHEGVDFDFLQGASGSEVKRDSH